MIGIELPDHDTADAVEKAAFRARAAGARLRGRRDPDVAAARAPRGPGRDRARASSRRPSPRSKPADRTEGAWHRRSTRSRSTAPTRRRVAAFWCRRSATRLVESDAEDAEIRDPSGAGWPLLFQVVPEGKSVKNRLHLDIRAAGLDGRGGRASGGLGATVAAARRGGGSFWTIMLDLEGNEFCVLRGPEDGWAPDDLNSKVATMRDAVAELVRDGDTVAIEGFTHLICFAAGHEIIRQRKRDLTLCAHDARRDLRPDDRRRRGAQARVQLARQSRRRLAARGPPPDRAADPAPLEIEEYSHFGMVCRYVAGASNLPFFPIRSYYETDIPKVNPQIVPIARRTSDGTEVYVVPPLHPDVTIVHAQRADADGDAQIWGLLGCQKEAAFAAERVIVVCEEMVDEAVDPPRSRTAP